MDTTPIRIGPLPPHAVLAHELRSPIAAMVGLADAMSAEVMGPLPAAYAEYARLIHQTGLHALAILAALDETALADDTSREVAGEVVREVSEAIGPDLAEKSLEFDLVIAEDAAGMRTCGRALRQILFNLLTNAAKFTGRGGRVGVGLGLDQTRLRLEVVDSGPGSPIEVVAPMGRGLGLQIVRALCASQDGAFELEITPGGATARAWLAAEASA